MNRGKILPDCNTKREKCRFKFSGIKCFTNIITLTVSIIAFVFYLTVIHPMAMAYLNSTDINNMTDVRKAKQQVRILEQSHSTSRTWLAEKWLEKIINEDSYFDNQNELTDQTTQVAEYNDNEFRIIMNDFKTRSKRFKRNISRERRDCDMSVERCKTVLQSMQNYLEKQHTTDGVNLTADYKDILRCLECNKLKSIMTKKFDQESPLQPDERYFSAVQDHSNDSLEPDVTIVKLLDEKAKNGSYFSENSVTNDGVNQTETTTKIHTTNAITNNVSREVTKSLKNASEATTVPVDSTSSSETIQINGSNIEKNDTVSGNNKQLDGDSNANNLHVKLQSNESVPITSDIVKQQIAKSKVTKNGAVTLQISTTATSTETVNNISEGNIMFKATTTVDSTESSETITRNPNIDHTERLTITENTSLAPGYDVTRIDNDDGMAHPSTHPSFEGHPENHSAAAINEPRAMPNYPSFGQNIMQDRFETKHKDKPTEDSETTGESTKAFQEMQMTPMMSWTMPHPICFYAPPGQFSNRQSPSGPPFYPGFPGPSSPPHRGPPLQNPPAHQNTGSSSSSQPSYVQVQAQSVQFMPRLNYPGNLGQSQPTGSGVGPTGPGIPNFNLNQQPTAAAGTSPNAPLFCTYVSMPTFRFPPVSGTTQLARSDKTGGLSEEQSKAISKAWPINWKYSAYPNTCPLDSRQCASDGYCVLKVKWCDGRVDCTDASDEIMCSCRDRISRDRLCDGYFDCPHGEDELGCFNCPEDSFSCDDWDQRHSRENCVPLSQRCDGIEQCRNGKDEMDCSILSASYIDGKDIFTIGYTQGYLHKNIRGQWYPVCSSDSFWAMEACASETGQSLTAMPEIQIARLSKNAFQGPYVKKFGEQVEFVASCSPVFVKCPPLTCGTRVLPRENHSPASMRKYLHRRHVKDQQHPVKDIDFDKLYQETLGLLMKNSLELEMEQDSNDTTVGSQVRVVGGRASQPRAWPFLVAIYKDGNFHCGGVILNEIWILTAAHCMEDYNAHYFEVQAGMLRRFSFSPTAQSRKVKNIIIHTDYRSQNMQNDIAIIMLDKPLLFNRWIRQVCLPAADTAGPGWKQGPTPHSTCIAIGWGATREHGPDPDHLREVEVPILSSCKYPSDQNDATICAGYAQGGHDACQGDSGGPLMCRNPYLESQWYVAGVISHGDGCARPNEPGAYTKVSYFTQWIQKQSERPPIPPNEGTLLANCPGFNCQTGLGNCLPIEKRCNGIVDCLEAEDEVGCISQMNYGQYRQSDFENEFMGNLTDEASNGTVENQINTEAPISAFYEPQKQAGNYGSSNTTSADTMMREATSVKLTFTCTSLIQTITINKRCDKRLDCEDGTDEVGCTCRDFLLNLQPTAICDGQLDCDDKTDEKNCHICEEDEFHCSRSGKCIPIMNRCNGKYDCPLEEDEIDCFALTNGEYVNMDRDNRPVLNMEGLLSKYRNRMWRIECLQPEMYNNKTVTTKIGENICKYFGFQNVQSVDTIVVNKIELETKFWTERRDNETGYEFPSNHVAEREGDGTCSTIRIRCRPVLSSSADRHLIIDPRTESRSYLWPWLAAIFVDGRYRCSALLLESDWLLTNSRCTEDIRLSVNYTTVLLGQSRSYLYVDGPYQQVSVIDEIRNVKFSDVSLLHLKTAANFTRHVLPLFLEKKIYPPGESDLCVAIGTDKENVTHSIYLQPILENCDKCYRCFAETLDSKCPANVTWSNWSGTVFCHSWKGWYPAAVFQEDSPCSFQSTRNLTSIDYIHAYLTQALEEKIQPAAEPICDGIRCNIGQCIPSNQVCDGVTDCRDGADEKTELCNKIRLYNSDVNSKCAKSELRCGSGECIPKSMFCDGKVNCMDGTDEPVRCTCAEYLKLTAPGRLCDGVRHCFDKTDESPEVCHCTETSFKCDNTQSQNITCIPQDFICDGDTDCPNGDDEKQCRKLKGSTQNEPATGEVIQRSYGVWHSQCFSVPVTSQEQAKAACEEIGYANGTIARENGNLDEPIVPYRDDFYMIRLNLETWITMRDDKPLITLVRPEDPCYRLFVECT